MKKLFTLACAATVALLTSHGAFASTKKTDTTKSATTETTSAKKAARAIPFRGTISTVDKSAKTFTIKYKNGKSHVYMVTDKTVLKKRDGKTAATWDDLKADAYVTGSAWKKGEGKYEAKTVKVGLKTTSTKHHKMSKKEAVK